MGKTRRNDRLPFKEAQINMTHLLKQPQQKLQLTYKTTVKQNDQKVELYGSLTNKELKKSNSSKWVGGANAEMWNRQYHTHAYWIKIRRYTLGAKDPTPTPDHPAQGSSTRKVSPHNFWL